MANICLLCEGRLCQGFDGKQPGNKLKFGVLYASCDTIKNELSRSCVSCETENSPSQETGEGVRESPPLVSSPELSACWLILDPDASLLTGQRVKTWPLG